MPQPYGKLFSDTRCATDHNSIGLPFIIVVSFEKILLMHKEWDLHHFEKVVDSRKDYEAAEYQSYEFDKGHVGQLIEHAHH